MTKTKIQLLITAVAYSTGTVLGFTTASFPRSIFSHSAISYLQSSPESIDAEIVPDSSASDVPQLTAEEEEQIGNLVANEEWSGLSMELTEVIATAVVEDLKKNSRDFLGKADYSVGDFSKEIDKRVKDEVAKMREKDDYEVSVHNFYFINVMVHILCRVYSKNLMHYTLILYILPSLTFTSWAIFQLCWMIK